MPLPPEAYRVPEWLAEDLRQLHAEIILRLNTEAAVVPTFSTINDMVIERIASNYVYMRQKERARIGEEGGFEHERNQKELNTFWLAMTDTFLRRIDKAGPMSAEAKAHMLERVSQTIIGSLRNANLPDGDMQRVVASIASSLEEMEL